MLEARCGDHAILAFASSPAITMSHDHNLWFCRENRFLVFSIIYFYTQAIFAGTAVPSLFTG